MPDPIPFLDLGAEQAELRAGLDAAWARVRDGNALILGPELSAFEAEFATFCGTSHALGVGNGLDALKLALIALGIGAGDEVIVPAHTFVATWLAVMGVGAVPVACEPAPGSYNISAAMAAPLITPRTKAVIAVHLYGHPADPEGLAALCEDHGIALVEDAAQAHGATSGGKAMGSFGRIGCFSFYPTKNLGALGDGGAVVTDDADLADKLSLLRNYGAREKYYTDEIGTNSRLDELQAAFLRVKLAHYPGALARRRAVAARYLDRLAGLNGLALPQTPPGDDAGLASLRRPQRRARRPARPSLRGRDRHRPALPGADLPQRPLRRLRAVG